MMLTVAIVAVLALIAVSSYTKYRERIQTVEAISDIGSLAPLIGQYALDNNGYPNTLADIARDTIKDPWGNPYRYLRHDTNEARGQWRKDHNIVPINSDYDLWSSGKDGLSSPLSPQCIVATISSAPITAGLSVSLPNSILEDAPRRHAQPNRATDRRAFCVMRAHSRHGHGGPVLRPCPQAPG
jgi:general secretion pathway protein G